MQDAIDGSAEGGQELAVFEGQAAISIEPAGLAQWEEGYLARLETAKLQTIVDALTRPLDAQACELRTRGIEAYRNAWFEDAYLDLTEAASMNRYDFTVHQVLGNIALAHREDLEEAAVHFSQAAKYAAPKSPMDSALAHVSLAAIAEQQGDMQVALGHARDAVDACSTCAEARYATAKYLAATDAPQIEISEELLAAVRRNAQLAAVAQSDPLFEPHRDTVDGTVELQRAALVAAVAERVDALSTAADDIEAATQTCPDPRLHALTREAREIRDGVNPPSDDLVSLVVATGKVRREGSEFLSRAARQIREVSDTIVRGQAEARGAAAQRYDEVVELKFMFAAVGALLCGLIGAGFVFLGLLTGRTTPFMSALAIPALGLAGAIAGTVFNGIRARGELASLEELPVNVCGSMEVLATSLEALGRSVASPFRAPEAIEVQSDHDVAVAVAG